MSKALRLAYIPLCDALPLLVAEQAGFFAAEELRVELHPMRSWAQLRDALLLEQVDAAHCLAGIPVATQAGLFGPRARLSTALTLNHFGNAITLSQTLLNATGTPDAADFGRAFRRQVLARRESARPVTLASVFPVSKHEFELRHWLRGLDIDPDYDVNLIVVPPPLVHDALQARQIDGFCVGEPWNRLVESHALGQVVATSQSLELPGTEKVLAVRTQWLEDPAHFRLLRAVSQACDWLGNADNLPGAVDWLSTALEHDAGLLAPSVASLTDPSGPHIQFAGINRPDTWHARWLLGQMDHSRALASQQSSETIVAAAFRPDLFDAACG